MQRCLREGVGRHSEAPLREQLQLPEGAEDRELAYALINGLVEADLATLNQGRGKVHDPRSSLIPAPVASRDTSFLGRLRPDHDDVDGQGLADMADLTTLLSVLRAGSIFQRRAAARRIVERLGDRDVSAEQQKAIVRTLDQLRDVEVAFELRVCRARLPGSAGREAQRAQKQVLESASQVEAELVRYWEGESTPEPLMQLSGDWRAQLFLHARELSDSLMAHLCALIENGERRIQRAMLSAARYAGDPRLVPSLVALLQRSDGEVLVDAARAISRVEDPRVWPALLAAYERSVVDTERIILGAALGRVGDHRAADYVRERLRDEDEHVLMRAIEALRTLGAADDVDALLPFLRSDDPIVATKAAHTLGRISDGRALSELRRLQRDGSVGALRAAAEEAADQIDARLVLRGEEPPSMSLTEVAEEIRAEAQNDGNDSLWTRLRAYRLYLSGRLWQLVGASRRALALFEAAATIRPNWALPLLVAGMSYAHRDEYAQALAAFRRALEAERGRVERNPLVMRALARCFLRRSEQVEQDGRTAIARGLLDEVMALDLRRAPSSLRFEIGRRYEALRLAGPR